MESIYLIDSRFDDESDDYGHTEEVFDVRDRFPPMLDNKVTKLTRFKLNKVKLFQFKQL
jgi:hypothetical protein